VLDALAPQAVSVVGFVTSPAQRRALGSLRCRNPALLAGFAAGLPPPSKLRTLCRVRRARTQPGVLDLSAWSVCGSGCWTSPSIY